MATRHYNPLRTQHFFTHIVLLPPCLDVDMDSSLRSWLSAWRFRPRLAALFVVATLSCLGGHHIAFAAGHPAHKDLGKDLADQAASQFKAGNFLPAAELFERAFALAPDKLVRLRNAGRAYQEGGQPANARLVFQRYLDLAPESAEKQEVRQRIAQLDERPAKAAVAELPAPATATATAARAPLAPGTASGPGVVGVQQSATTQSASTKTSAWLGMGLGMAALGGGAAWWWAARQAQGRIDADVSRQYYDYPHGSDKLSHARSTVAAQSWAAVGTATVGAAALGYGIYRLLQAQSPVALAPWSTDGGIGWVASAAF